MSLFCNTHTHTMISSSTSVVDQVRGDSLSLFLSLMTFAVRVSIKGRARGERASKCDTMVMFHERGKGEACVCVRARPAVALGVKPQSKCQMTSLSVPVCVCLTERERHRNERRVCLTRCMGAALLCHSLSRALLLSPLALSLPLSHPHSQANRLFSNTRSLSLSLCMLYMSAGVCVEARARARVRERETGLLHDDRRVVTLSASRPLVWAAVVRQRARLRRQQRLTHSVPVSLSLSCVCCSATHIRLLALADLTASSLPSP